MRKNAFLSKFARARDGATTVEYALLIALIASLSIVAWTGIGDALKSIFEYITSALLIS